MRRVTVLSVGGTSESSPGDNRVEVPTSSLAHYVTRGLDRKYFTDPIWVGYPADYGMNGMSYADSVKVGRQNLVASIVSNMIGNDNLFILQGFSQGATVVREVLGDIDAGIYPGMQGRVIGGANVASPVRREDALAVAGAPLVSGYGIGGEAPQLKNLFLFDLAAVGDPICGLRRGARLRDIADLTNYMQFQQPEIWVRDMVQDFTSGRMQNVDMSFLERMAVLPQLVSDVRRYLPYDRFTNPGGGRHTCYAFEKVRGDDTYCDVLTGALNWKIKKMAGAV